ncbi:MAG: glycosyltransferase family 39 protein [Chthoniobacterales bacterium]
MTIPPPALHPWPWRTALVVLLAGLVWFGRNLEFNVHVHPDEPGKVRQILEGRYNFHHPLLMLDSVRAVAAVTGADDYDNIMFTGRRVAVFYAALGAALLVLVTGRLYGTWPAAAAGIFLLTSPQFFELAHYFKEDPGLVCGLALGLLAALLYGERPGLRRAAVLGLAAAVAASAKYAGLIFLPFAVYAVLAARRPRDLAMLLGAFAGGYLLVNWPAFLSAEAWTRSVVDEVDRLAASGAAKKRDIPHPAYLEFYWRTSPVLVLLLGLHLFHLARRRFRLRPVEWIMLLLPALSLAVISATPTVTQRYFLPVGTIFACLSAAGLLVLLPLRHGRWWAALAMLVASAWQWPALLDSARGFAADHQSEVIRYLGTDLPAAAFVLVDDHRELAGAPDANPRLERRWIKPGESPASLRAGGLTHVLVTQRRHAEVMKDDQRAAGLNDAQTDAVRQFYRQLFTEGMLVREWQRGPNGYLQASFRLYELPTGP